MSAVGISRKVYEYFKNHMVGTIDLNMLKTNAAFGDLVGWRKRAYELSKIDPKKVQLLNLYTIIAQNHDSVTGALIKTPTLFILDN